MVELLSFRYLTCNRDAHAMYGQSLHVKEAGYAKSRRLVCLASLPGGVGGTLDRGRWPLAYPAKSTHLPSLSADLRA